MCECVSECVSVCGCVSVKAIESIFEVCLFHEVLQYIRCVWYMCVIHACVFVACVRV